MKTRYATNSSAVLIATAGFWMTSCAVDEQPPQLSRTQGVSTPAASTTGTSTDTTGAAGATTAATGTTSQDASGTGAAATGAGDAGLPSTEPDPMQQLISDCGADGGIATAPPTQVILQEAMNALPFNKSESLVTVQLGGTLDVTATGASTVEAMNMAVNSITPNIPLLGAAIKSMADQQAASVSGTITLTNVPFSKFPTLNTYSQYKGVLCTLVPATQVASNVGGHSTVTTFDPPLPASLSPRAVAARYQTELGTQKVFSNLSASIVNSNDPVLSGKSNITGTVTIQQVSATATLGGVNIAADVAYQITSNFESAAVTNALGIIPSVTYYISAAKKSILAVVADTSSVGGTTSGVVNFIAQ